MSVTEPGKIITPWAQSGLKNPIPPAANPATGRAGFDQGFSAINMTAKEAGGIPPFGQDFNGIFYEVTSILRYMQAGGQPTFDATLATAIGGYPKGAMVLGSDGVTLWQSKVDSNSTNPNVAPENWGTFDVGLKSDLAAPGGSNIVGFKQAGAGSVPRTSQDKMRERVTPLDFGAVGDGVTDDSVAIGRMITYFKSTLIPPAPGKNYDGRGVGLDFSGRNYGISSPVDFTGIDNLTVINPSLTALSGFAGNAMMVFNSIDTVWYVENTTIINPYLDGNWNANLCIDAADFLNFKIIGGKMTHYKQKGLLTRRINVGPHEVNMTGTFIFQREYNETFPVDITEGEAFEIGNYDNNFTNVVIGYQKKWTCTLASGANTFSNCHFYSGVTSWPESGVRSLDTADDFDGCYFDSVPLFIRNRSTISDCTFVIEPTKDFAIELTTLDPFLVKVTDCRFRKASGPAVVAIKMKTIADGRINRPSIYDNSFDGCESLQTRGLHPVNISATSTTFALPDQYQPLSSFGPVSLAASADGLFQERMFGQAYNSTTKQITINCYAVSGGTMIGSNLGGKQALINFN